MENFKITNFIEKLISFGERQGEKETEAAQFIMETLANYNISYFLQGFKTRIPKMNSVQLIADNKEIPCRGTSFVSGIIKGKDSILSSLIPSRYFIDKSNINFNPQSEAISRSNFYFAPSLAVDRNGLGQVLSAREVSGKIEVEILNHDSVNILVGNIDKPQKIYIAHYDSIEMGATDNASGVAVLMALAVENKEILKNNLIIFSGNEELSYDNPTYWGSGFRAFEGEYGEQLNKAEQIIVIDCVGNGKTFVSNDNYVKYLSFPIRNIDKIKDKIKVVHGDIDKLMKVYHSSDDNMSQLEVRFLREAVLVIKNIDKQ